MAMKEMKKRLTGAAALILAASLAGCSAVDKVNEKTSEEPVSSAVEGGSETTPTEETTIEENNEFGLIRPDVCAPGMYIVSSAHNSNDGFSVLSGTSMATPVVSGAVALLLSKEPNLFNKRCAVSLVSTLGMP